MEQLVGQLSRGRGIQDHACARPAGRLRPGQHGLERRLQLRDEYIVRRKPLNARYDLLGCEEHVGAGRNGDTVLATFVDEDERHA